MVLIEFSFKFSYFRLSFASSAFIQVCVHNSSMCICHIIITRLFTYLKCLMQHNCLVITDEVTDNRPQRAHLHYAASVLYRISQTNVQRLQWMSGLSLIILFPHLTSFSICACLLLYCLKHNLNKLASNACSSSSPHHLAPIVSSGVPTGSIHSSKLTSPMLNSDFQLPNCLSWLKVANTATS